MKGAVEPGCNRCAIACAVSRAFGEGRKKLVVAPIRSLFFYGTNPGYSGSAALRVPVFAWLVSDERRNAAHERPHDRRQPKGKGKFEKSYTAN